MADLLKRDPSVVFLHQLLEELRSGQLRLPRFQRPYVWSEEQQIELLRSVADGIPMGSVLVWETEVHIPSFSQIGPHRVGMQDGGEPGRLRRYVLDGTQRLTTLLTTLVRAEPTLEARGHAPASFVYDLSDGNFYLAQPDSEEPASPRIPTEALLDDIALLEWTDRARTAGLAPELLRRARPLARAFAAYKVPVITFVGGDLETATRIFERVNRQGTIMSDLHMIHALSWGAGDDQLDLLSRVEQLRASLADVGWSGLEPESILRAAQLLLGLDAQDDPAIIVKSIKNMPETLNRAADGFRQAAALLRGCGLRRPSLLPYHMHAVILAAVCAAEPELSATQEDRLRAWFWLTTYWGTLFGRPKVRPVYKHLLETVRGGDGERWPQRRQGPYEPLPEALKGFSARVRSLGLLLAQRAASAHHEQAPDFPPEVFAEHGLDALPRLFPSYPGRTPLFDDDEENAARPPLSNAGNRILVAPQQAELLRRALQHPETCPRPLLDAHLISGPALDALKRRDIAAFITARADRIGEEEEALLAASRLAFFRGA